MWTFVFAGALYLVGVAVVLVIRPAFMFDASGNWLEFGIGKGDRYTQFPFWLFCLAWAIVSYLIVLVACRVMYPALIQPQVQVQVQVPVPEDDGAVELPKGYYMLNKKATKLAGVPKYVYLGTEPPEV